MDGRLVEQTPMRAAIARRMAESKQQAPHFYVQTEVEMDALPGAARREQRSDPAVRVTVTAALVRRLRRRARASSRRFNAVWTRRRAARGRRDQRRGRDRARRRADRAGAARRRRASTSRTPAAALGDLVAARARGGKLRRPRSATPRSRSATSACSRSPRSRRSSRRRRSRSSRPARPVERVVLRTASRGP